MPKPKKDLQTGRSLPTRYSSYSPGRQTALPHSAPTVQQLPSKRSYKRAAGRTFLIIIVLFLAGSAVLGAWDARNISNASQKMFGSGNILTLLGGGGLQTDTAGRVNVLIAGYSADDPGHAGATLTDSIMLLSMDKAKHSGYMLSIPRDLYVAIPGNGYGKINEAYGDGGMKLLEQIVEKDFGVSINYYALVNYASVRTSVDALGGIDVNINSPEGRLYDPNRDWATGGPLVDLSNGQHHLNGEQALDLTRARGDPTSYGYSVGFGQSDFQRTADQRLVFTAIKSKLNWKLVLNPRKNAKILNAAANNIKTDVAANAARPLFGLFNSIPNSQLRSLSLRDLNGKNYLASTYYEGSTLTPAAGLNDFSQIQSGLSQLGQ
jgi:LCP family protein required for cell wall assembly